MFIHEKDCCPRLKDRTDSAADEADEADDGRSMHSEILHGVKISDSQSLKCEFSRSLSRLCLLV
jgi:hypothetical protein